MGARQWTALIDKWKEDMMKSKLVYWHLLGGMGAEICVLCALCGFRWAGHREGCKYLIDASASF